MEMNSIIKLLSDVIREKLSELDVVRDKIKEIDSIKDLNSCLVDNVNKLLELDIKRLEVVLRDLMNGEELISTINELKIIEIVCNGIVDKNLDLNLNSEQISLINNVSSILDNRLEELSRQFLFKKEELEKFLADCTLLSSEIGKGMVSNISILDKIFDGNNISYDERIGIKFEILKNNSKNYDTDKITSLSKDEVSFRVAMGNDNFDLLTDNEKKLLLKYGDVNNAKEISAVVSEIEFLQSELYKLLLFSDKETIISVLEVISNNNLSIDVIKNMFGIIIPNKNNKKIQEFYSECECMGISDKFLSISSLVGCANNFIDNCRFLCAKGKNVKDYFNCNPLSLIIPSDDFRKNFDFVVGSLDDKCISVVIMNSNLFNTLTCLNNPYTIDYLNDNPIRLRMPYQRSIQLVENVTNIKANGCAPYRKLPNNDRLWLISDATCMNIGDSVRKVA